MFARSLRPLGIPVDPNQIRTMLATLDHVSLERREDVEAAARTVLVTRREHLGLFDRAFDLFWSETGAKTAEGTGTEGPGDTADIDGAGDADDADDTSDADGPGGPVRRTLEEPEPRPVVRPSAVRRPPHGDPPEEDEAEDEAESAEDEPDGVPAYSDRERLKHKDFARLTGAERRRVEALIARHPWRPPRRRTRRRRPGRGHHLDLRRTWRHALRHGGQPISLAWQTRKVKPRPLVVLCDVSGSMEPYSRLLLQFVYVLGRQRGGGTPRAGSAAGSDRTAASPRAAGSSPVEVFVFGTRLTRVTRALAARDADAALRRVANVVEDFDGGTRIGNALRAFNVDWGRRVLRRGAIALVISDGWDRGDVELLEREVDRLHRSCHRLLWLNPLLGSPGYEPLTPGIRAILRHVDDFLPVHDLASLDQLGKLLEDLTRRAPGVNLGPRGMSPSPSFASPSPR